MSDVTVEVEPAPVSEPVVIVENDSDSDAVMDVTTIELVERVTRLEDGLALVVTAVEALTEQMAALHITDEVQQEEIEVMAEEVEEVAESAADAIEETVEDVDEASSEITPDELPTVREHPFFRKWGRK